VLHHKGTLTLLRLAAHGASLTTVQVLSGTCSETSLPRFGGAGGGAAAVPFGSRVGLGSVSALEMFEPKSSASLPVGRELDRKRGLPDLGVPKH
jgi:hypothetical protein